MRSIDADALFRAIKNSDWLPHEIDIVPVRCKDCKHCVRTEDGEFNPDDIVCNAWMTDGLSSNDFCSYGERRDENEQPE